MKLFYITNTRIPTEKAHGIAVMKMCEAFARGGNEVVLIVPWRRNPIKKGAFEFYGMENSFPIRRLPSLDLLGIPGISKVAFFIQACTFYLTVYLWAIWQDRSAVIYTTDAPLAPLSWLGFTTVFECHAVPNREGLFFRLAHGAHRIVVTSREIGHRFRKAGFSARSLARFPNGVDLGIFDLSISRHEARERLGFPQEAFIALYTGNFTTYGEEKGIADSIKALAGLDNRFRFIAVGGSPDDCIRYARLAEESVVSDRVTLVGNVTQRELAVYQRAADALLMPYPDRPHYRHNMSPMKLFEYLAAGRPIVASDLPTVREIVTEKEAYLIAPDAPHAIAAALRQICGDPEDARRRAGAAHALSRTYTWDARAAGILRAIMGTDESYA